MEALAKRIADSGGLALPIVTIIEPGLVETEISHHVTDPVAKKNVEERLKALTPLESEDIARAIAYAVTQPPHVNVNEILIRPTQQER